MSEFAQDVLNKLTKKAAVIEYLTHQRRVIIQFFQSVVDVNVNVQRETKTPLVNFTNDIISDLPPRAKALLMTDFAEWLQWHGRELATDPEAHDVEVELELAVRGFDPSSGEEFIRGCTIDTDRVEVTYYDRVTSYRVTNTFTVADLAPFLQAGLDWHPSSRSFFIPRS